MNTLPIKVNLSGKDHTTLTMRLDSRRCGELCEELGKDINDILTSSISNPGIMAKLINAAIRHKFNCNPADVDGYDVYDAMVDEGYKGTARWMEFCAKLAEVSGIASRALSIAMTNQARKGEEEAIRELNDDGSTAENDEPPSPTQAET